jgi:cation diffusion facilitator family transporter
LVNVALIVIHALIAVGSGSLAVAAELVHNFVDLAAAGVVVAGLKLATRKSKAFPYGLYKVENLIAAGLAILIFFTAYEIVKSVFFATPEALRVDAWMLASLIVTIAIPLVFSHFEMRVARETNSPALMADAREYRVHVYTTGLAFAALLSGWLELPLDRLAALIIVIAVAKTGWDLLVDALRVLLDASLDAKDLGEIRRLIEADPAVADVAWITGRNAGRFRFVEAGVAVRPSDVERAEAAVRRIENTVRASVPQVERILLHVETRTSEHERCAVPLSDLAGRVSEHFGEAPYFALVTVHRGTGAVVEQHVLTNPYRAAERAKGIRVAEWLAARKVDRVYLPKSIEGKGPSYVFREAGIAVEPVAASTLAALFQARNAQGST